ncbi:lipopolysaccharide biosynthesis protein [Caminibacter pacificus]
MLNKIKPKSEFTKNVLTLMTGTTIAQAIPILISPILTRLYSPENFGIFALFASTVSLLSIIAGGRYEGAIIISKTLRESIYVLILTIFVSLIFSIFLFIIIFLLFFVNKISIIKELGYLSFLVPFVIISIIIFQSFYNFLNKIKEYKTLAKVKVLQTSIASSLNIIFALTFFKNIGLIISYIITSLFLALYLFKKIKKYFLYNRYFLSKKRLLFVLKKYKNFPKYDIASAFLNNLSLQLPIFLLSHFYGVAIVGLFMLSRRIVGLPIIIISSSITTVFKQHATDEYNKYGKCDKIFINTLKKSILIALPPSIILFFIAPKLFEFIFGKEWADAGYITQILIPMFFLRFVTSPLSYMFYIANKQNLNLLGQLILNLVIVMIFFTFNEENYFTILYLFSIVFSIYYLFYLYLSYKFAKGKE